MGLHHRKLLDCVEDCIGKGPKCCDIPNYYPPTPPSPSYSDNHVNSSSNKHIKTTYLIISFSIVAAAFIIICCYAIYVKFFSPRNRSTRRTLSRPQTEEDFLDEEEYGPVVDHPIWYIRTTGLQQAVIGAITVCNYKKDEGLIEGTECSVCLSEFQEDESLRLLPKCNHAFHLPCIDTWLRSHTNCPMCRAPIVTDPTRVPSMDPNAFASTSFVEEVLETGLDNTQNSSDFLRNEQDEGVQPVPVGENEILGSEVVTVQPRRSVSLDSSSANKISLALATVLAGEFHGNTSNRVVGNGNLATAAKGACSSSSSSTSSVKRSRSFNAKHLLSWYNRSQRKPNPPLRSF